MSSRRMLPANPYGEEPLEIWQSRFQSASGLEDRYRAFVAVTQIQEALQALRFVATVLNDREPDLRAAAANWIAICVERQRVGLVDLESLKTIPALVALLKDDDPDVQLAAARALGVTAPETPGLVPTVVRLMGRDDTQPTSERMLAELCGRIPEAGVQCLTTLRQLLSAEQADVREAAAQALVRLGASASPAIPELIVALEDVEPLVRESAAIALGQLGPIPDDAVSALKATVADDDELVAKAAQASLARLRS